MEPTEPTPTGETEPTPRRPRRRTRWARITLALVLVAIAAAAAWGRGLPIFVAWEAVRDHERCFTRSRLPARLWSSDPVEIRGWLEDRGTPVQPLPARSGRAELVGVRYCPLADRVAAHIYYGGRGSVVSVLVLSGPARVGDGWAGEIDGFQVRLFRSAGRTIAVVGKVEADVDAVSRALLVSVV
jgi:hypothetical protein